MMAVLAVDQVVRDIGSEDRGAAAAGHPQQYRVDVLADSAACEVLIGHGLGVLSEESGLHFPERRLRAILDPIDGSANCAAGRGPYGPSLCLVDDQGPLAGIVYDIASGACFRAERGQGAVLDGRPLARTAATRLRTLAVGDQGLSWGPDVATAFSGASAHDLCRVAAGAADAYVDVLNTQAVWDYLAAALVIMECGGVIRERSGAKLWEPRSGGVRRRIAAASSVPVWNELMALLLSRKQAGSCSSGGLRRECAGSCRATAATAWAGL